MADAPSAPAPAAAPATAPTGGGSGTSPSSSAPTKAPEATAPKAAAQKRGAKREGPAALDAKVRKGMEERQKKGAALKLISKGNAPAADMQEQAATAPEQDAGQPDGAQAEPQADKATEDAQKAAEEHAHWTQKAKADLAAKDQQITTFKQRESEWKKAAQEAVHAREDIESERDYYRQLFEGARAAIASLGHEIDPLALKVAEHEFELAKRDRVLARGKAQTEEQAKAEIRSRAEREVSPRLDAIFKKHPALNTPEGHKYLRAHVVAGALDTPDGLENAAAAFAIARGGASKAAAQAPAQPPQTTPQAAPAAKPASAAVPMTLSGQGGGGGAGARSTPGKRLTPAEMDKKIVSDMARRRAANGR